MDDLNLNPQLVSNNSPLTNTGVTTAMDFDSQTERNSVNTAHIRNFSFSQGTGGTLTLTEGMSIVNSAGTTVIDSTGLVSANNFGFDNYLSDTLIETNSTSAVDVTGSELSFVLTRSTRVLFLATINFYQNIPDQSAWAGIEINGTYQYPDVVCPGLDQAFQVPISTTTHKVLTLGAGTHTVGLAWKVSGGTAQMDFRSLTYLILGN